MKILMVDDHVLIRDALRSVIKELSTMQSCSTLQTAARQ
jgi:DNA-binding NarL/FixJ family response regulator